MRYTLKQIHCRPWTFPCLSVRLIESHYENNNGGALRRLNAITEQLESPDFENAPGHALNGLKREELVALSSTRSTRTATLRLECDRASRRDNLVIALLSRDDVGAGTERSL